MLPYTRRKPRDLVAEKLAFAFVKIELDGRASRSVTLFSEPELSATGAVSSMWHW